MAILKMSNKEVVLSFLTQGRVTWTAQHLKGTLMDIGMSSQDLQVTSGDTLLVRGIALRLVFSQSLAQVAVYDSGTMCLVVNHDVLWEDTMVGFLLGLAI